MIRHSILAILLPLALTAGMASAQSGIDLSRQDQLLQDGYYFDGNLTNFGFGSVGTAFTPGAFTFSGHGQYELAVSGERLGLWEGLFVQAMMENRYGDPLNSPQTTSALPVTLSSFLPGDSEVPYLTNLIVAQALNENLVVFGGKMDSLRGDRNDFAHGRGITQFSNLGLVVTPLGLLASPYSTLGAGFTFLRDGEQLLTCTVRNATDTSGTIGVSDLFNNGAVLNAELRLPWGLLGSTGHHTFGALWSSRTFDAINDDPRRTLLGTNLAPIAPQQGSWVLYHNFDQYLMTDEQGRGWGLFGRLGIADRTTNPFEYFISAGVGGNNIFMERRANDSFGAGWYLLGLSNDPNVGGALATLGSVPGGVENVVELFYNARLCDWASLTFDSQMVVPAVGAFAPLNAILGARLNINF